jgi:ATP-dependent DNA helicase DinG
MLSAQIQKSIRQSYQNLKNQLENFTPRREQNFLISEIAKTLCGTYHTSNRMLVAEAGTGIGKSISYLMGAIPIALLNNRRLVISTATVALQEQLIHKDLPLYRSVTDLEFQFRIAKGRQRYCCAEKLAGMCHPGSEQHALFGGATSQKQLEIYQQMYTKLCASQWDGDRDSWPTSIEDVHWQQIVCDKYTCNTALAVHHQCPFHKARSTLEAADVIIANHSLVMADMALGGGVILPEPEKTMYVFDEAHHIPRIARDHASASISLQGAVSWLEKLNQSLPKWAPLVDERRISRFQDDALTSLQDLIPGLNQLTRQFSSGQFKEGILRFEFGKLPEWFSLESKRFKLASKKVQQAVAKIIDLVNDSIQEGQLNVRLASPVLAELGFYQQRLENLVQVWTLMVEPIITSQAPPARWIAQSEEHPGDYTVNISPIEIGWQLEQQLWSRCCGVILMSATLRALNSFTFFCRQTGISQGEEDGVQFLALASPFDYSRQGELYIPQMSHQPQSLQYTEELIRKIPQLVVEKKANLILFSSYWQMNQVAETLKPYFAEKGWLFQVQGTRSRTAILKAHRHEILDRKGTAILFGTGSFAEGLDLPGQLLENVVITKIPFSVPTSPVEQAQAEYITAQGGNPFMQVTVPEASRKLVQCAGRLLRNEQDSGRVIILDRRIITKHYGKALLDALPPFRRMIEW